MQLERHVLFWLAFAALSLYALDALKPVLLPFVAGMVIAYFLNPVVDRLWNWGFARTFSTVFLLLLAAASVAAALLFLVPPAIEQGRQLMAALPGEAEKLRSLIEHAAKDNLGDRFPQAEAAVRQAIPGLTEALPQMARTVVQSLWSHSAAAFNLVSLLLITPLVAFYMLLDWPKIVATVDSWLPRANADQIRQIARDIDVRVSAFIRGQGVVCLLLAAFYAIALSLAGLHYGMLVGLLTGLFSFIPFVGWALGFLTALALAIVQYWPQLVPIAIVAGIFLAGQLLDAALLSPQIVGSSVGLHPVWLIFSLLVFSYLFGFLGLLVAVPVAAAIGVLARFGLETYMRSSVYRGRGA